MPNQQCQSSEHIWLHQNYGPFTPRIQKQTASPIHLEPGQCMQCLDITSMETYASITYSAVGCITHTKQALNINIEQNFTTTTTRPFVRVSQYQKKHSPTHPPSWSSSNLYQLLPSTTIHSILTVQSTCLAIFLHNLSPCPLWSTSWSGALHLIFLQNFTKNVIENNDIAHNREISTTVTCCRSTV